MTVSRCVEWVCNKGELYVVGHRREFVEIFAKAGDNQINGLHSIVQKVMEFV